MDLTLSRIGKRFKTKTVLEDISFDVGPRELVSVIGPSGVGKTTLLKIIARLDAPNAGEVVFSSPPSRKNPVILVFQDYVLFPGMTVWNNISFGLKSRRFKKAEMRDRVERMLDYFRLQGQRDQYPAQLSAGQKQRVAIARAMVINPAVLLLDEPFANLDRNLKMETARFIRKTQKEFGIPTVSVTHDLEEAFAMSDKIGILLEGRLKQFDTPKELYFRPNSHDTARFLGPVNIIPRELYPFFGVNGQGEETEQVLARPESLILESRENGPGWIKEISFAGHYIAYEVSLGERIYTVYTQRDSFRPGQRVNLKLVE
ncbi:MAG: ABC transporter ATP-binding protein [Desulfohalobiaceae bacterium]|nr:ABC transporter ATP-binding protein [Desulfohalobiaceae bacterium]